jgi:hypothetical protein
MLRRFVSEDPIKFGDFNLYAYVKNNPVVYIDPWGLAQFGKRPLNGLPFMINSAADDYLNTEISHEQLFFEDGKSPGNLGFFDDGLVKEDPHYPKYQDKYQRLGPHYDDELMRKAVERVVPKKYCRIGNNCQDWADQVREEYERLKKQREKSPCMGVGGRKPRAC